MKYILCLFALLAFGAKAQDNLVFSGIADTTLSKKFPEVSEYRSHITFPPFVGWTPDGKKMLFDGSKVLYSMKSHKSEIKEYLTSNRPFSPYPSPNRQHFLYLEDEDGDENYQLFIHTLATDKSQVLTEKGQRSSDPYWSPDSGHLLYKSNKRNPAEVDLYLRELEAGREQMVFRDFSDDGLIYDWGREKHLILAVKVISENHKSLYFINDTSLEVTQINPEQEGIAYSAAKFIPNQSACFLVSDEEAEFLQLIHYDYTKNIKTNITRDINWDVEKVSVDAQGETAAFSVNVDGYSELYLLNVSTLTYRKVEQLPKGFIQTLTINPQGTAVGFNFYGSTFRRKIFRFDVRRQSLHQVARKGKIPTETTALTPAESFNFPSRDPQTGKEYQIPAFIYRAKSDSAPVLIDIHGGPEYQIRASFNGFYQYLVNWLGITVIVPNVRGSNGYGKSYMKLDDGFNRENAIEDVGALLDWVKKQPGLNAERVAIYGESYGGYVALSALTHYPQRLRCGIDVVGISNWLTYLNNTADYRRDLRRVEFGDERKPEMKKFLEEISPANNLDKIESPLLIFQGLNDPRVNYQESEQVVKALQAKNKEVWYVLAKDEGHGFQKYENYLRQRNLTIAFLRDNLLVE